MIQNSRFAKQVESCSLFLFMLQLKSHCYFNVYLISLSGDINIKFQHYAVKECLNVFYIPTGFMM